VALSELSVLELGGVVLGTYSVLGPEGGLELLSLALQESSLESGDGGDPADPDGDDGGEKSSGG